jgi:hypothetical protein
MPRQVTPSIDSTLRCYHRDYLSGDAVHPGALEIRTESKGLRRRSDSGFRFRGPSPQRSAHAQRIPNSVNVIRCNGPLSPHGVHR